ncbi:DUF2202 domain-containing protein [Aerosakkonemataceae cyanobacterium BLCC-F154]|uniref:DUF2202 domain-containing protein n=1 Tax=Floridaenema fluviatile BLCC-F154 TaxID=3153640 RepID=A0ABV4Y6T4_9CYAN
MNNYQSRRLNRWRLAVLSVVAIAASATITNATTKTKIDNQTQQAMIDSINDEYQARAFYNAVIKKFGEVRPFSNIVHAEDRHVNLWKTIFTQYGLPIPPDKFAGKVDVPDTLQAACQAGVKAEIANVAMYDRFLTFIQQPDLRAAFSQLRYVSQERHLPAFQRCVNRQIN